jgi:hypothetical protein
LWAVIDMMSMLSLFTSTGTLPMACTASVWKSTPRSRQSLPISAMGCITPISLLAYMMVTRMVLSVIDSLQHVEIDQAVAHHRQIGDAIAVLLQALAGIEHGLVLGDRRDDVVALLGVHLGHALDGEVVDSVAPLVKMISLAVAPIRSAICLRAFPRLFGDPAERGCGWRRCRTSR